MPGAVNFSLEKRLQQKEKITLPKVECWSFILVYVIAGLAKAIKINRTLYKPLRFSRKYVILNQVSNALTVFLPVAVAITRMISETRESI